MKPSLRLLIAAIVVSLVCGAGSNCDGGSPRSKTVHCKDGSNISGPGVHANSCDSHGGLG